MKTGNNWIGSVCNFYRTGFRDMTIGKTLWLIIGIKLFIMFAILRIFFFPDFLNTNSKDMSKEDFVGQELIERIGMEEEFKP